MTTSPTIAFTSFGEDFLLHLHVDRYTNGRLALSFWTENEWGPEPFAKVTVNMPEDHLNEGEFFVKDWAENAPLVEHLVAEGWLLAQGREVLSGYVAPGVYRAGGPLKEFLDNMPGS